MKVIEWNTIDSFVGNSWSSSLTHRRPCPLCGSARSRSVYMMSEFQFFSDSNTNPKRCEIINVQCLDCSTIYLNPSYSKHGFEILFAEAGKSYGSSQGRSEEQINWLDKNGLLKPNIRLLDVGCYDGRFLGCLPSNIHKVGVDIDKHAIKRAQHLFGDVAEFFHSDLKLFSYPDFLNVITMFHVLEHLDNPVEVLKNLLSVSTTETRLIIEVPILEQGITNDICGFLTVQHLTHFSRASLSKCMAASGWEIEHAEMMSDYNGYRILARPSSNPECTFSSRQDTFQLYEYFSKWYAAVKNIEETLFNVKNEHIVIWGAGMHTEYLYQLTSFFRQQPKRKFILIDSDSLKANKTWRGITIHPPDILKLIINHDFQLLISSYFGQEQIAEEATKLGINNTKIIKIYSHIKTY